jgi:hypothetical protein
LSIAAIVGQVIAQFWYLMQTFFGVYNVMYAGFSGGAKGDGVTDDTAAIQAAMNAAADFGVVVFPPKTFAFTNLAIGTSHVTLRGSGQATGSETAGTVLRKLDGTKHGITVDPGNRGFVIENLTIDGAGLAGGGDGIHQTYTTGFSNGYTIFRQVTCRNNSGHGFNLGKAWVVLAERCIAYANTQRGFSQEGGTLSTYDNCISYSNGQEGFYLTAVAGLSLRNSNWEQNGARGCYVGSCPGAVVEACEVESEVNGNALEVWGKAVLIGNRFYACGKADGTVYPIAVDGGGCTLIGNVTENSVSPNAVRLGAINNPEHFVGNGNVFDKPISRANGSLDKAIIFQGGDLDAKGGYRQSFTFYLDAVAANLTNSPLKPTAGGITQLPIPYSGSLAGIAIRASTGVTAGSITVRPTINGSGNFMTAVLNTSTPQTAFSTQPKDNSVFNAGDLIGCTVTTSSDFTPVGANIIVTVTVEF